MAGIPKFNDYVNPSKIMSDVKKSWDDKKKGIESVIKSPELQKYANAETANQIKNEVLQAAQEKGEGMISGLNLSNFSAEGMSAKADEYKQTFTDAMGRFKDVDSFDSAKTEFTNLVNEKMGELMPDMTNLNANDTQSKIDDAMSKFNDISNVVNTASTGIGLMTNPKKTAARLAINGVKEIIDSSPKIQEIKDSLFNELKEKISNLPQVKEYKDKYEGWMAKQGDIGKIPSDVQSAMDNPEKLGGKSVNSQALLENAIRDSGLAKKLIASWGGNKNPNDMSS